jgi:hypothetical protein
MIILVAGVDGFITIIESGDARGAFLRGGVYRFKKYLKSEFFILFHHFRETRFIGGKPLFPSFFFQFLFSGHLTFGERSKVKGVD